MCNRMCSSPESATISFPVVTEEQLPALSPSTTSLSPYWASSVSGAARSTCTSTTRAPAGTSPWASHGTLNWISQLDISGSQVIGSGDAFGNRGRFQTCSALHRLSLVPGTKASRDSYRGDY